MTTTEIPVPKTVEAQHDLARTLNEWKDAGGSALNVTHMIAVLIAASLASVHGLTSVKRATPEEEAQLDTPPTLSQKARGVMARLVDQKDVEAASVVAELLSVAEL